MGNTSMIIDGDRRNAQNDDYLAIWLSKEEKRRKRRIREQNPENS